MIKALARLKDAVPITTKNRVLDLLGRLPPDTVPRGGGTAVDLYVWIADDDLDTVVPVENWYSILFPDLDTATSVDVEILGPDGQVLGTRTFDVPRFATLTLRVSQLLDELAIGGSHPLGSMTWYLRPPSEVANAVASSPGDLLFWDRSYIGYEGRGGHVSWIHGVDKSHRFDRRGRFRPWPIKEDARFTATPEIPVDLQSCERFEVLVQNRAVHARTVTLTIADESGGRASAEIGMPARSVRRLTIDDALVGNLDQSSALHLEVANLPTRYGRPIALRWFSGGAFSVMHC